MKGVYGFAHGRFPKYAAEFVGTFFLVFTVGCNVHSGSIGAAVSIGAILMVMVYSLGSVSGAHLNPAVTFAIALCGRGKIDFHETCCYIMSQISGAIVAALTYMLVFEDAFGLAPAATYSHHDASSVEILYTAALCYVVLNVATTENKEQGNPMPNHFFGLAIGLTVTAAAIAVGPVSGCALNPAVSIGSLTAHMIWHEVVSTRMWALYILSPLGGSLLAAIFFYAVQGGFTGQFEYEIGIPPPTPTPRPVSPYTVNVPRQRLPTRNLKRDEIFWLPEECQGHRLTIGLSWEVEEDMGGSVDIDASCVKFTRDGRALQSIYFENRFGKEIKAKGDSPEESIIIHRGDNLTGSGTGFGLQSETTSELPLSSGRRSGRSAGSPLPSGRNLPGSSTRSKSPKSPGKPPKEDLERIEINTLARLRQHQSRAEYLFMTINIFSAKTKFDHLKELKIRIVDADEDRELCYFEKLHMKNNHCNGFVLGVIFWRQDRWCFKIIDESFEMPEHKTIRYLEPKLAKIVKQMEAGAITHY